LREQDLRSDLATFTLGGLDESMGKQPLANIPVSNYGNNYIEFLEDNIHVKITSSKFEQTKHKFQYYDQYVVRIDNKPFYGVDGQMPEKKIESIAVAIGNDSVQFLLSLLPIYTNQGSVVLMQARAKLFVTHGCMFQTINVKSIFTC
jgi:hypothetical protein